MSRRRQPIDTAMPASVTSADLAAVTADVTALDATVTAIASTKTDEAPIDGTTYGRKDGAWSAIVAGAVSWTETELDFGTAPVASKSFTVTDAGVTGTSKIVVVPSGNAPTSGYSDVWEWDTITFAAVAGTGQFTVYASVGNGTTNGKHKVFYNVS